MFSMLRLIGALAAVAYLVSLSAYLVYNENMTLLNPAGAGVWAEVGNRKKSFIHLKI